MTDFIRLRYFFIASIVSIVTVFLPGLTLSQNLWIELQTNELQLIHHFSESSCMPKPPDHLGQEYQFSLIHAIQDTRPEVESNSLNRDFFYFRVYSPWEQIDYPWETLVAIDTDGQCTNLIAQRAGGVTLTTFMPPVLAGQMALANYRQLGQTVEGQGRINRLLGNVTPDPDSLNSDLDMDQLWIAPEDAWALQQLGYEIPDSFSEYPPQIPYQERESDEIFINLNEWKSLHVSSLFDQPVGTFHVSNIATLSREDYLGKA